MRSIEKTVSWTGALVPQRGAKGNPVLYLFGEGLGQDTQHIGGKQRNMLMVLANDPHDGGARLGHRHYLQEL